MWSCATCFKGTCLSRGLGLGDLQWSLPAPSILWSSRPGAKQRLAPSPWEKCAQSGISIYNLLLEISSLSQPEGITSIYTLHTTGNMLKSPEGTITRTSPGTRMAQVHLHKGRFGHSVLCSGRLKPLFSVLTRRDSKSTAAIETLLHCRIASSVHHYLGMNIQL